MLPPKRRVVLCALLVFLVSFAVRVGVSFLYTHHFDVSESGSSVTAGETHAMIKAEMLSYYWGANQIIQEVKSGKPFFLSGPRNHVGFLYPRLLALYGLASGKIVLNDDRTIPPGQIFGFFVLQSCFFSLCLFYFVLSLSRILSLHTVIGSSLFLALEPAFVQFGAMLMTEVVFVSFLLLAVSVWSRTLNLKVEEQPVRVTGLHALLGLILGAAFLQRPAALFFPLVFVLAILSQHRWRVNRSSTVAVSSLVLAYVSVLLFLGWFSFTRSNSFTMIPTQGSKGLQSYLANHVLAEVNQTSSETEYAKLFERALTTAKGAGLVRQVIQSETEANELESYRLSSIATEQALGVLIRHPWVSLRIVLKNTLKSLNIDPFYTYRLYTEVYKPRDPEIERLQEAGHAEQIPARIAYSLLILCPALIGWLFSRHHNPAALNVLFVASLLYFPAVGGWIGFSRYNIPCLIFYSVFWSLCVERLLFRWRAARDPGQQWNEIVTSRANK